jgi:hypothetical protein
MTMITGNLAVREFQWSPVSPGPGWNLVVEEDCVTYTRRLWEKRAEPRCPLPRDSPQWLERDTAERYVAQKKC